MHPKLGWLWQPAVFCVLWLLQVPADSRHSSEGKNSGLLLMAPAWPSPKVLTAISLPNPGFRPLSTRRWVPGWRLCALCALWGVDNYLLEERGKEYHSTLYSQSDTVEQVRTGLQRFLGALQGSSIVRKA